MGTGSKHKKPGIRAKKKEYKRALSTKRRPKDIDQIQDELRKEEETGQTTQFEYDDDLPGGGQFFCTPCSRHFADEGTLDVHRKSKLHKRRLKDVAQQQYTQGEAEFAAGMSKEMLPPAHGGGGGGAVMVL